MKRILGTLLLATLIAGCTDPIPAHQDKFAPSQVLMSDYWLQAQLAVTVPKPNRTGAGQLDVTVELYNKFDSELLLQYKYWFTDKNGQQVENNGVGTERIKPRSYTQIHFTSLSAAADDFRVQLMPAK